MSTRKDRMHPVVRDMRSKFRLQRRCCLRCRSHTYEIPAEMTCTDLRVLSAADLSFDPPLRCGGRLLVSGLQTAWRIELLGWSTARNAGTW